MFFMQIQLIPYRQMNKPYRTKGILLWYKLCFSREIEDKTIALKYLSTPQIANSIQRNSYCMADHLMMCFQIILVNRTTQTHALLGEGDQIMNVLVSRCGG